MMRPAARYDLKLKMKVLTNKPSAAFRLAYIFLIVGSACIVGVAVVTEAEHLDLGFYLIVLPLIVAFFGYLSFMLTRWGQAAYDEQSFSFEFGGTVKVIPLANIERVNCFISRCSIAYRDDHTKKSLIFMLPSFVVLRRQASPNSLDEFRNAIDKAKQMRKNSR